MNKIKIGLTLASVLMMSGCSQIDAFSFAATKENITFDERAKVQKKQEKQEKQGFCESLDGQKNKELPNGKKIDCMTEDYVIKITKAKKWDKAVGRILYYANISGKKPAIAIKISSKSDEENLKKLQNVAKTNEIKVFELRKNR